jgi:hydroxyethylthiazole kinase-like uncharacterized protein yjeF
MERILPPPAPSLADSAADPQAARRPLLTTALARALEAQAAQTLPPHTLMARAGAAVARLARAWQPHARRILVLAGGGNNGGDGWHAAALLAQALRGVAGSRVQVWRVGDPERAGADARWAYATAREAGVEVVQAPPTDAVPDLLIDALLGLGTTSPVREPVLSALRWLHAQAQPCLCVDLPSGLDADTGRWWAPWPAEPPLAPRITLALLNLKPGLFTGAGRSLAGQAIWFDDLGVRAPDTPTAWLRSTTRWPDVAALRASHHSHKGSRGDVLVLGGQVPDAGRAIGMTGAALLAARAALRAGAGRVTVGLLTDRGAVPPAIDPQQPALMLRSAAAAMASQLPERAVVVAGCGGGTAVAALLPELLARAPRLVLDADALNTLGPIAGAGSASTQAPVWRQRRDAGWLTVLTPHPLEAARLLGVDAAAVQADRLAAAQALAERLAAIVVLKGSGTVVACPEAPPLLCACGNGLLATAGTGDVLAGLIGARLATIGVPATLAQPDVACAVADAVLAHGALADAWQASWPPTAGELLDPH